MLYMLFLFKVNHNESLYPLSRGLSFAPFEFEMESSYANCNTLNLLDDDPLARSKQLSQVVGNNLVNSFSSKTRGFFRRIENDSFLIRLARFERSC